MQKNTKIPDNWKQNKVAVENWLKELRKRRLGITLRQPEATSIAHATGFNITYGLGLF